MTLPRRPRSSHRLGFTLLELLVCVAVVAVLVAFLLPPVTRGREAARRTVCKSHLKQIGLAFHNYHDKYGAFPPAYTVDAAGKPLHSWRTLLLPFLDHADLYAKIDLTNPWDDPVNAAARQTPLPIFCCPSNTPPAGQTNYLAIVTDKSCLQSGRSKSIPQVTDGLSNTLLVIETPFQQGVPWMSPQDADETFLASLSSKPVSPHSGGRHALLADGSVRFLSQELSPQTLTALTTAAGGETIGEF